MEKQEVIVPPGVLTYHEVGEGVVSRCRGN